MPEELNKHFSGVAISSSEDPAESFADISTAPPEGFSFAEVSEHDVILMAVSHFNSQARGEDGIPQCIIARACNASLLNGVFPLSWKKARILALKKTSVPSSPSDFRNKSFAMFLV